MKEDTGNSGERTLCPNCWAVRGALLQSILNNWVVFQELWDEILEGKVDSEVQGQVIGVQTQIQSFNFSFEIQLGVLVLRHTDNLSYILQYSYSYNLSYILQYSYSYMSNFSPTYCILHIRHIVMNFHGKKTLIKTWILL